MMLRYHDNREKNPQSAPRNYEFRFKDREGAIKHIYLTVDLIPESKKSVASLQDISENKRILEEIEHRLQFEQIISTISRDFINQPKENLDQTINRALAAIGTFSKADRSYLFLLSEDGSLMSNTHEWCATGIMPQISRLQNMQTEESAWTFEQLRNFETITLNSLDDLPDYATTEREVLSSQDIRSMVLVPMTYEDSLRGFLGFDSIREEKQWSEGDITLLRTVGDIIINALEKRSFELRLQASEQKYRDFVNFLPQAVFETDINGKITFVNQYGYAMFGYSESDFFKGVNIYQVIDEEDYPRITSNIQDIYDGKLSMGNEYTGVTREGKRFPVLIYSTPVFRNGRPSGLRGIIIDLTVRKDLEDQLRQAQKMEAIGRLAGGIAHDFNNILTSIVGHCDLLLLYDTVSNNCKKDIEHIINIAKSGSSLTRQLLAFSRKQILNPVVLNINHVITKTKKMLSRLIGEEITIETDLDEQLDNITADAGQIEQIIMNLVINGSDAMPQGGTITLRTANTLLDEKSPIKDDTIIPGPYVLLQVIDTGHGMDNSLTEKAVEPFFTTKQQGKGTGLGLSTVYGIVKQSGGYLEIKSRPQYGTSVSIYFPTVEGDSPLHTAAHLLQNHGNGERIIIAEDNEHERNILVKVLNSMGYLVFEARHGHGALALLDWNRPIDLLLTDRILPEMKGEELARRAREINPKLRVLYITEENEHRESNSDYIQRPFSKQVIAAKVREILSG
jgi:PAS domain S-box-containing protein